MGSHGEYAETRTAARYSQIFTSPSLVSRRSSPWPTVHLGWLILSTLVICAGLSGNLTHAQDVDYDTQIEPIFQASCSCHVGIPTSGVDLSSYDRLFTSVGVNYGTTAVVPFQPDQSPLIDKIENDLPQFGGRMPFNSPALSVPELELMRRWVDQGARDHIPQYIRGDANHDESLDISDPIAVLFFLIVPGSQAPYCEPLADSDGDGSLEFNDPLNILRYLLLGAFLPPPLSEEEIDECSLPNRSPSVQAIGTITAEAGLPVEFEIDAIDDDWDLVTFVAEEVPEGLTVGESSGIIRWTPDFTQVGDHRIRIRCKDNGSPPASTMASGLIRVTVGNFPPSTTAIGTRFGRETVQMSFFINASDEENHPLLYEIEEGPTGTFIEPQVGLFEWTPTIGDAGEHPLRVRITDAGVPPRSVTSEGTLVVLAADAPNNQTPFITSHPVYRAHPGFEIALPVDASDPDGNQLKFNADQLPDGAALDQDTGLFTWSPGGDQLGPFYVPITVEDDGVPPESVEEVLVFHISPIESCTTADCDPALGCEYSAPDRDRDCCMEEPQVRLAEAKADCPEGRVLHVGRNIRGFGRLQNCDQIQIIFFPQGGANVRLNFEARCINSDSPATIHARLETENREVFDAEYQLPMTVRGDGFAQTLTAIFPVNFTVVPIFDIAGAEALLTVELTDSNGIHLEKHLKLILSTDPLDDLPDPDVQDVPPGEGGCVGCHRPIGPTGERHGIEDAHPWFPLACTDCHGGEPLANTVEDAHPRALGFPSFLKDMSSDQLDNLARFSRNRDYLRFINPGDMRVADVGCGSNNPANPGSGCHQDKVDTLPLSVMSTYVGHYSLPRFLAGSQGRETIYAAVDRTNENYDPDTAPPGTLSSVQALREPDPLADRSQLSTCMDIYLPKSCPTCHLSDFGPNNAPGNYRSSGCTACHMLYGENGLSQSEDPMINKDFPTHPTTHQLTSAIPVEQCTHCHFQGGRIGFAYRGIREGGFSPEWTPENAVPLGRPIHDHDSEFYFVDEDSTNDYDETPPDLHYSAGMVCADCHVGSDVHGDNNLYASERYQIGVRCEDCHGTVRAEIEADENGVFRTEKGSALRRIRRTNDNRVLLKLTMEDRELEIPQIHRILESGVNQAMNEAMGVNEEGFSHTDKMECYTCHTSWRQTCFGCHITIDDRQTGLNRTTGLESKGGISVSRDMYSTDFFALGVNERGNITPLCSSMSIFMTYIDENGEEKFRDRVRTSSDGLKGMGWNPFHHHTVSRVPQNCDQCHPVVPGSAPDNFDILRETYGFGRKRYVGTDGDGVEHDMGAFLDEDGNLMSDFPHPNTGPVPREIRERAMSIEVLPQPRQEN